MALLALFAIIRSFLSISVSTNTLKKLIFWSKIAIAFTFIELVFTENYTLAQIIPDETLGNESTVVTPDVNIQDSEVDRIDGGAKRGTNLFHSFREFNVGENQKIYFTNPTGIKNIFSRVTGTNISNIQGTLGVDGIANLFLINPNGIIFGANASLDLKGSFLVSTADAVKFADGISFSATNPSERSLLSINVPIGLQLPGNPQRIELQGSNLALDSAKTLAFVGGEVTLNGGKISNPGGTVELGGLATENTVGLNNVDGNLSLTFPEGIIDATGQISLDNSSIFTGVSKDLVGNGGNIKIATSSLFLNNGARLSTAHSGKQGNAGNVIIHATNTVYFEGSDRAEKNFNGGIMTIVQPAGKGNAGDIIITTGSLYLKNGASFAANTNGQGNAGSVIINADNAVVFQGEGSSGNPSGAFTRLQIGAKGQAGNIDITTNSLYISDGARLETITNGKGNAGNVTIHAREAVYFDGVGVNSTDSSGVVTGAEKQAVGNAGNIAIKTGSLFVTRGARIANNTAGNADKDYSSTIKIEAANLVSFDGVGSKRTQDNEIQAIHSGIFGTLREDAIGQGGSISIKARNISFTNGGVLATGTLGNGNAGTIALNASETISFDGVAPIGKNPVSSAAFNGVGVDRRLVFEGGRYVTGKEVKGQGGTIEITTKSLSITNGAVISTRTFGEGDAGNIIINAEEFILSGQSNINGFASVLLSSTEAEALGKGGNITIEANTFRLADGALVNAQSLGDCMECNGGNIEIETQTLEIVGGGQIITTSSGNGKAGNIAINASDSIVLTGGDFNFSQRQTVFGEGIVRNQNNASGLFANTTEESTNNGGNIAVESGLLIMRDGAKITTNNEGSSNGGNINIAADFIVASPSENSDISANAVRGSGGNVTINARGIVGIVDREKNTPESDITASSELGIDGTVSIDSTTIDPNQGLIVLPEKIVDASALITTSCGVNEENSAGQFSMTGRGGLPTNPNEVLSSQDLWEDLRSENFDNKVRSQLNPAPQQIDRPLATIAEATGWNVSKNGKVTLVATNSNAKNISHSCRTASGQKSKVKSQ